MTGSYQDFCPHCKETVTALPIKNEGEFLEDIANGKEVQVMHPPSNPTGKDHIWMTNAVSAKIAPKLCPIHKCELLPEELEAKAESPWKGKISAGACPEAGCGIKHSTQVAPESGGFFTLDRYGRPKTYWAEPAASLGPPTYKRGE